MGDVTSTEYRAGARSAVALAMNRWGCRQDPNTWQWDHLAESLAKFLRGSKCRFLGDAWMMATLVAEGGVSSMADRRQRQMAERRETCRWQGAESLPAEDPMSSLAPHFAPPQSTLLFEPMER